MREQFVSLSAIRRTRGTTAVTRKWRWPTVSEITSVTSLVISITTASLSYYHFQMDKDSRMQPYRTAIYSAKLQSYERLSNLRVRLDNLTNKLYFSLWDQSFISGYITKAIYYKSHKLKIEKSDTHDQMVRVNSYVGNTKLWRSEIHQIDLDILSEEAFWPQNGRVYIQHYRELISKIRACNPDLVVLLVSPIFRDEKLQRSYLDRCEMTLKNDKFDKLISNLGQQLYSDQLQFTFEKMK